MVKDGRAQLTVQPAPPFFTGSLGHQRQILKNRFLCQMLVPKKRPGPKRGPVALSIMDQTSDPAQTSIEGKAGNPKERGNAITNRFSEGCTRERQPKGARYEQPTDVDIAPVG